MKPGFVRIIAGKWRGRRLKILPLSGLRPTPDRVRETIFNWLTPYLVGAYCLDLFAGSGALGFEALSRGAAFVEMVDESHAVVQHLKKELILWEAKNGVVSRAKLPKEWPLLSKPFDIVFIDPPYHQHLLIPCCQYLEEQHYLAKSAFIYLEAEKVIEDNELPINWRIIKQKKAGQVFYHLAYRETK